MGKKFAICFLCVVMLMSGCVNAAKESHTDVPIQWTPVYNDHSCGLQAQRTLPEGATQRDLTPKEISTVVPYKLREGVEITGWVCFRKDKTIDHLSLHIPVQDTEITVVMGQDVSWGSCCLSLCWDTTAETSACGSVKYALFRSEKPYGVHYLATGQVNTVPILVRIDSRAPSRDKIEFERILCAFAQYYGDSLSLDQIKP